eukprot:TRINITY_DN13_c0_g1_i3.p1 TRINITY_DN13_c0_g1~~TRINITY_DN13_c0_g1_i3.p1  ORF type:complete len:100 (-),score=16.28 TRINITY_DN13_c0_g1_i3:47-346(-)
MLFYFQEFPFCEEPRIFLCTDILLAENDCHGVFWFLALDEFNMVSAEDASKTKMLISMELLSELVNYEKTQKLTMIIFLNKSKFRISVYQIEDIIKSLL